MHALNCCKSWGFQNMDQESFSFYLKQKGVISQTDYHWQKCFKYYLLALLVKKYIYIRF